MMRSKSSVNILILAHKFQWNKEREGSIAVPFFITKTRRTIATEKEGFIAVSCFITKTRTIATVSLHKCARSGPDSLNQLHNLVEQNDPINI